MPWVQVLTLCIDRVLLVSCNGVRGWRVGVALGSDSHTPLTLHWVGCLQATPTSRKRRLSEPSGIGHTHPKWSRSRLSGGEGQGAESRSLAIAVQKESMLQSE